MCSKRRFSVKIIAILLVVLFMSMNASSSVLAIVPRLEINDFVVVSDQTAQLEGRVTSHGVSDLQLVGFRIKLASLSHWITCYSKRPTSASDLKMQYTMTGLEPNTTYSYQAFAVTSKGVAEFGYSQIVTFTTAGDSSHYVDAPYGDGVYYIKNAFNMYTHILNASQQPGAVIISHISYGGWNTQYMFTRQVDGSYKITNPTTGLVLTALGGGYSPTNNSIGFWEWVNTDTQKWYIEPTSSGYRIRPKVNTTMTWSVSGNSSANATAIILFPINGSTGQYYELIPAY